MRFNIAHVSERRPYPTNLLAMSLTPTFKWPMRCQKILCAVVFGFVAFAVPLSTVLHAAAAPSALFDSHVHLWKGEASLQVYEDQLREKQLEVAGIGAMWFGGFNQALAGQPQKIQAGNDGMIALAAKHPKIVP